MIKLSQQRKKIVPSAEMKQEAQDLLRGPQSHSKWEIGIPPPPPPPPPPMEVSRPPTPPIDPGSGAQNNATSG